SPASGRSRPTTGRPTMSDTPEDRYWNGHLADCLRRGGVDRVPKSAPCSCGFVDALARSTPAEALPPPLFDPESEDCQQCGQPVGLVWTAPDDLWQAVTGITDGSGIRCIPCFDKAAE